MPSNDRATHNNKIRRKGAAKNKKTDARIVFPEPAVLQVEIFENSDKSDTYAFPRPKVLDYSLKAIFEIGGCQ